MKKHLTLAPIAITAALVLAACGGAAEDTAEDAGAAADTATAEAMDEMSEDSMASEEPMASEDAMMSEEPMASESAMDDMAMAGPVGPGCADFATAVPEGEGSVEGMSDDPVAVAASNNPILTTLTAAVSGGLNPEVNLVDTLNGAEFTVFAPVDEAFARDVDAATLETLKTDTALLSSILTYHVIPGQIAPADLVGTQTSVQGGTVEVAGTPEALTVNGTPVICGGVTTANATVYLIDGVLMPTA